MMEDFRRECRDLLRAEYGKHGIRRSVKDRTEFWERTLDVQFGGETPTEILRQYEYHWLTVVKGLEA